MGIPSRIQALLVIILGACQGSVPDTPTHLWVDPAPSPGEFSSELLFATAEQSFHRASARGRLAAHLHEKHAETVYVLEGHGRMLLGETWIDLGPGSLVHVPVGTLHALHPQTPMTALSIFAPPFDGKDRIFPPQSERRTP